MFKIFIFFHHFTDDEEGQFEPTLDDSDKERRMMSESPLNKTQPLPEARALFIFSSENS